MYHRKPLYPEIDRRAAGAVEALAWCRLPPDVEPLPKPRPLGLWLHERPIAACDRGAACKGLVIGTALGELVLWVKRMMAGDAKSADRRLRLAGVRESFPRLRRVPFYRRARALQFKRNYGR